MGLTYEQISAQLGVKVCQGNWYGEIGTPEPDHVRGFAERTTVHWWPARRVTRAGLRHFLMLVAATRVHRYERMSKAEQIYAANFMAVQYAKELHIRIPTRYSEADRRRVRWLITKGEPVTPAARRWANRIHKEG